MYQIEITNSQDCLDVDTVFLSDVARRTLSEEQVRWARVSIVLVDNATLRELNRRHLGHDYDTDVLSFLLECSQDSQSKAVPDDRLRGFGKRLEGEVIVSTEMALETAQQFQWTPLDEVVLYVVHGLLHLVGYDDRCESELEQMRSRERAILKTWNLTPRYAASTDRACDPNRSALAGGMSGVDS